jgi:hypothetical protein
MSRVRVFLVLCAAVALPVGAVRAQQAAKPGPELEKMKALEGVWDATAKFGDMESKGTMTMKMDLGGMWLSSAFEGEFGGQKFSGKGFESYDPTKKKYVNVWVDSMSNTPMIMEGSFDKDGKVLTYTGEGPGEDGKLTKMKTTIELKDKDNMVFKMYGVGKDGKDAEMFTITYKRKK